MSLCAAPGSGASACRRLCCRPAGRRSASSDSERRLPPADRREAAGRGRGRGCVRVGRRSAAPQVNPHRQADAAPSATTEPGRTSLRHGMTRIIWRQRHGRHRDPDAVGTGPEHKCCASVPGLVRLRVCDRPTRDSRGLRDKLAVRQGHGPQTSAGRLAFSCRLYICDSTTILGQVVILGAFHWQCGNSGRR